MNLYRARYEWPDGRKSNITFASRRINALGFAADYVRIFVKGYLLELVEERALEWELELHG